MTGKYTTANPFPAGSIRAQVYNRKLPQLTNLVNELKVIGAKHKLSIAQTAMAWALAKGAIPIIGVTEVKQVVAVADVAQVQLSRAEIAQLEGVADAAGVNTIGSWEQDMRQD